jgi:hypothetical protein
MDYVVYVTMHNGSWHVNAVGQLSFDLDGSDRSLVATLDELNDTTVYRL